MQRRSFLQQGFAAGSSALISTSLVAEHSNRIGAAAQPFQMDYAFHDGMFKNSGGNDFVDQIQFAYNNGFRSIEDNGMMARPVEEQKKIADKLAKLNMKMGVFVVAFDKWPLQTSLTTGTREWKDKFLSTCKEAVDVAKRCNARWMTVVPGNYDHNLSIDYQTANVIDALRRAADIFEPHGLIMVLEPLSDTPQLFLRRSDQTYLICQAVNSASCKILFDMYHMQRNEGNIINNINKSWDQIAYFQVGDNPGRKEPGTGEMNYRNIFKHIRDKGYKGILGMEHGNAKPGKDGEEALIKAYRDADNF
jgi:hydroxypyruvate isomerase